MAEVVPQGRCGTLPPPSLQNGELLFVDDDGAFAIFQCSSGYTFYSDTAGVLWCDEQTHQWPAHQTACYVDNSTTSDTTTLGSGEDNFLTDTVVAAMPGSTTALIIVGLVAGILLLFVAGMCFLINRRRNRRKRVKSDGYLFSWIASSGKWNRLTTWLSTLPSQPRSSEISDESGSQKAGSGIQPGTRRRLDDTGPAQTSIYIDSHTAVRDPDMESWHGEVSDKLKLLKKGKLKRDIPDGNSEPDKVSTHGNKSVNFDKQVDSTGKISAINGIGPASSVVSIDILPPGIPQPYDIEVPPSLASSYQEIGAVAYPDLDDIHFRRAVMIDVTTGRDSFRHVEPIFTHL